ncbi:DUF6694 family lipoprotein [Idiomarina aminovorans]|uniref:DUF6694 family lipoprotein n=1 Tax=Idiomarina aminovorans TaxID=2914829 RepID=UPI002004D9E6|nr:DUF6694 family lipoprotein [Idiomarina sp. ATCH4]MCK7458896.1 hypothetical protein [Idiomarina sp. ATCH4]
MWIRFVLIVLLISPILGCSEPEPEPELDNSTEERLRSSSQQVRQTVPESRKTEFDEALKLLVNQVLEQKNTSLENAELQRIAEQMHTELSGKTADEVFAEATRVRELQELLRLERKNLARQAQIDINNELKQIEIMAHELYEFTPSYDFTRRNQERNDEIENFGVMFYDYIFYNAGDSVPVFDVTFKNSTERAIYSVQLLVTVFSSASVFPFFEQVFVYPMPNGLEPGGVERVTWAITPSSSIFRNPLDVSSDKGFEFIVESIAVSVGPEGETLLEYSQVEDLDTDRLLALKRKYGLE